MEGKEGVVLVLGEGAGVGDGQSYQRLKASKVNPEFLYLAYAGRGQTDGLIF